MADSSTIHDTPEAKVDAAEVARFLRAFVECDREIRDMVLEMTEIIVDPASTDDERILALDAITEALFPEAAADVVQRYRQRLREPDAVQAAEELAREEAAFADRVRVAMARKGMTQEELARRAGIGQPAVSNILNRRCRPQTRTVAKFAEALGVSPAELWPGQDN